MSHTNKEEAKQAFIALLRDCKIKSTMKWQDALPLIVNDQRYRALSSLEQRTSAFQQYISQAYRDEQEERTKECELLQSGYRELLNTHLENKPDIRYREILSLIEEDRRFLELRNFYTQNAANENYIPVRSKRHSGDVTPNEMMEDLFYNQVDELSKQKKKRKNEGTAI